MAACVAARTGASWRACSVSPRPTLPDRSVNPALQSEDGFLRRDRFDDDALEALDQCTAWLLTTGRSMYLPIDLVLVLVQRGHPDLRAAIARAARDEDEIPDLEAELEQLARRVERHHDDPPRLHHTQFSLGFAGLLEDAWRWVRELKRERIAEEDLVRVVRWRAELQESASVRWAIRQLGHPGGQNLFDDEGTLLREAFDHRTWSVVQRGMVLAAQAGMPFLGTPHLVAALCTRRDGLLARASERAGVEASRLQDELLRIVGNRVPAQSDFVLSRRTLTPRMARTLVAASDHAREDQRQITEPDLLSAFVDDGGSSLELVRSMGIVPYLEELLGDDRVRERSASAGMDRRDLSGFDGGSTSSTPTLDLLGVDLTAEAVADRLPAVLGRDDELQRIINVLLRSEQRNPLLTGQAGVGKTALAAALASQIADGRVPARLKDLRVVEINGASLIGGTSYRGELEARIKALLSEAEQGVILFIDEAHAVFAPRSSSGQPAEVPNHFKAALASGRIAVVAATTEMEYHRWIEQDPALRRRFERIEIAELSPDVTRTILAGLAPRFEQEWEVPVTPDAVDAAIELSQRFMPEQSLPDKAKKLLMDATISVSSDLALAGQTARPEGADPAGTPRTRVVGRLDVARQVASKTGIPLDRISRGAMGWWVGLDARLKRHVIGQDAAVDIVAMSLVQARLNNAGRRRPQGVFVFAGQPGVGRTRLTRALAVEVFGSDRALLRLEMADFQEAHSLSRLIGSPPGYVGYQDEDALVTPLRRRPSSVILLKDFDLAHPRVQERFVRLFEEGQIADTRGLPADASHAIFVLTLSAEPVARASIGFGSRAAAQAADVTLRDIDEELHERLKGYAYAFVPFRGVDEQDAGLATELLDDRIAAFVESIADEYAIELVISDAMYALLHEQCAGVTDARDVEGLFRDLVVSPVSERLLEGTPTPCIDLDVPSHHTGSHPAATEPTRTKTS